MTTTAAAATSNMSTQLFNSDYEFKSQPCDEAILCQSLPSDQNSRGMQCVFVKDAFSSNVQIQGTQLYGLMCPIEQDASIQWIKNNQLQSKSNVKSFAFLQLAEKCLPFKKFEKLANTSKIVIPGTAYLKLLQFFGVKNDPFSEWNRVTKKLLQQLETMKTHSQELRISKSLKFVGNGICKYKNFLESFNDDIELCLCLSVKSKSTDFCPVIFLTYALRENSPRCHQPPTTKIKINNKKVV